MSDLLYQVQALEQAADDFGFSWENPQQIMAQILSECEEIQVHLKANSEQTNTQELQEEIGDLLHAVFSLAVFCQFNPKKTLEKTLSKFENRLTRVKQLAYSQGLCNLKGQPFDELMRFWNQAKQSENAAGVMQEGPTEFSSFQNKIFTLDERLQSSCFYVLDWPLSRVLLKNNANYPWLILVPRRAHIREVTALTQSDRYQLIEEVYQATAVMQDMCKPHKINMGALGNIVPQLHLHIIARFKSDPLWPQGVWQANAEDKPYGNQDAIVSDWVSRLSAIDFGA